MKISKLFHWLYALVMLLPIFAIGVTCGYAMFNKNAYQSYGDSTEITNITNVNQLQVGKRYRYTNINNINSSGSTGPVSNNYITYSNVKIIIEPTSLTNNYIIQNSVKLGFYKTEGTSNISLFYYNDLNEYTSVSIGIGFYVFEFTLDNIVSNMNFLELYKNVVIQEYSQNNTIDNVFYYSIDRVQQSPLFNWAYNSFLVTPFAYIVSLFSMPQNSFIVMLLSYWLAISIIWLLFDLVMYVPLLVHRWIDKGVLE